MALEQLGFEPCHHMYDVVESPSIAYWREISAAHPDAAHPDAACPDAACPDAKVLLTRRPVDAWFKSFSKTILPLLHQRDKDVGRGDHPEGGDDPANHP